MEGGGLRKYPMILALKLALDFLVTVLSLIPGKPAWWSVPLAGTMCLSVRWGQECGFRGLFTSS